MPKKMYRPPEHLIKQWPEVFEDLQMDTMPVAYIDLIRLKFSDGRIWEIDIASKLVDQHPEDVADTLIETLEEYAPEIIDIDFDLNVDKLKSDIEKETKNLF